MKLSALTSSLPLELPEAIAAIAELGFEWIDLPPTTDPAARRALRERGLSVACVSLERDCPAEVNLASDDGEVRNRTLAYFLQAISVTAEMDAPVAYLTPPVTEDLSDFDCWTESVLLLADHAQAHGLRLCIEHFPGRALPTVAETLEFLERMQHEALALLLDVGHCLISGEDAAQSIVDAGKRLGYLHFDDNDGAGDLHWSLLDGQLAEADIKAVLKAQKASRYKGAICIELNPTLDSPLENLRRSREILLRCAKGR